jgi:hypothetical protein
MIEREKERRRQLSILRRSSRDPSRRLRRRQVLPVLRRVRSPDCIGAILRALPMEDSVQPSALSSSIETDSAPVPVYLLPRYDIRFPAAASTVLVEAPARCPTIGRIFKESVSEEICREPS